MKLAVRSDDLPAELKKHVAAVHVSGELSLIERKLVNVLLLNAFDNLLTKDEHTIPQAFLSTMVGWERSNNSKALKEALSNIATTRIEFDVLAHGEPDEWGVVTALASAKLKGGLCTYAYAPELKRRFANPDIYALINVNVQRQFQGVYALALYENCIRFKRTGSTGWITIENWKKLLGVTKYGANREPLPSAYDSFKVFSSKVIKGAVAEVNQVSNITIVPEYQKEKNTVTHIRFLIQANAQQSFNDGMREIDGVRDTEAYKALEGIGLTHSFILSVLEEEGEQRAIDIADYVTKREGVTEPAAYARSLYQSRANVIAQPKASKPVKTKDTPARSESLTAESVAKAQTSRATTAKIKALTVAERLSYFAKYDVLDQAKGPFDNTTGHYRDKLDDFGFTSYLRSQVLAAFPESRESV